MIIEKRLLLLTTFFLGICEKTRNENLYVDQGALRGDLCKSGPGHFASEKSFPHTLPSKLSLVTSK